MFFQNLPTALKATIREDSFTLKNVEGHQYLRFNRVNIRKGDQHFEGQWRWIIRGEDGHEFCHMKGLYNEEADAEAQVTLALNSFFFSKLRQHSFAFYSPRNEVVRIEGLSEDSQTVQFRYLASFETIYEASVTDFSIPQEHGFRFRICGNMILETVLDGQTLRQGSWAIYDVQNTRRVCFITSGSSYNQAATLARLMNEGQVTL